MGCSAAALIIIALAAVSGVFDLSWRRDDCYRMRARAIGSPWIVWIGVIGTVANGIAPILVGLFGWAEARILFAFMVGIAIWLLLAAVSPTSALRSAVGRPAAQA